MSGDGNGAARRTGTPDGGAPGASDGARTPLSPHEPPSDAAGYRGPDREWLGKRVAELEDHWRRALADLDNARKRYARESAQVADAEQHRVLIAWLPMVDDLERALEHSYTEADRALVDGVRAVRDQAVALLLSLGYPRDDETGVPFDPQRHEASGVADDPSSAPGTVLAVVRPGYGRPDRQLRPASVVVNSTRE
jgi:molecular chaperone GrpE